MTIPSRPRICRGLPCRPEPSAPWATISRGRGLACTAAIVAVLQVPTVAEIYRHAGRYHPALLSLLLLATTAVAVYAVLTLTPRGPRWRRVASSGSVTVALLGAISALGVVLRLHEEALHRAGGGASQADAMIQTALALFHGHSMYDLVLPGGPIAGPPSPGPAWVALNAPFALLHVYGLMIPFWMALVAVTFRRVYRAGLEVNVGMALLFSSPHLYKEMTEGQDTVAFCLALLLVVAAADRWLTPIHPVGWSGSLLAAGTTRWRTGLVLAVVVGAFAGVLATARIIYLPLPILIGLFVWRRNRLQGAVVAGVGVSLGVAANLVAAIGVNPYPPAHLFGRASQAEPTLNIAVGAVATAVVVVVMLWRRGTGMVSWLVWLAACVAVPHAFIGIGELEGRHFAYYGWEGANYLFVGAVMVVVAVLADRAASATPPAGPP
ncbi:MAG: hypothetical protein M3137_19565 [Actinomycetota bacterium]|nr:hypothetical protein [Actinomycetota bacterium]